MNVAKFDDAVQPRYISRRILGCIACIHVACCYVVAWSTCLCVYVLGTRVSTELCKYHTRSSVISRVQRIVY